MWTSAGIAYDYLFKAHPWHFFSWLELSAKGALQWERLPASATRVAKNVSKIAEYCRCGYDIPEAFQSFRSVVHKYQKPASTATPLWVEISRAVSDAAFLTEFGRCYIFKQPRSSLAELIGTVATLFASSHELYLLLSKPKEIVWESKAQFTHKISNVALVILSLYSLYRGVEEFSPNLAIFFTTTSLSSHFVIYCNA
jgi:hypothetical protein